MDKRKAPRYKRRIPLQFWSAEDRTPRKGFTQNVSVMGIFVATNAPFKPGTRVFLEFPSGRDTLILQAEVRFSARVDPALQRVKPSGMGVRLLRVDEIMSELLKLKAATAEPTEEPRKAESGSVPPPSESATPHFSITYETPQDLANSYQRDIKFGGLFVPADEPAPEDEEVVVEFRFAWDDSRIIEVPAVVVKRFSSAEGSIAGEAVSGMGVAFSDPTAVGPRFEEVLASPEQSGSDTADPR